jgi:hypothetical protein
METLEDRIAKSLATDGVCLVDDEQLCRVWPDSQHRYMQVKEFAALHGWRLFAYGQGRGAIFAKKGRIKPKLQSKVDLQWWCEGDGVAG